MTMRDLAGAFTALVTPFRDDVVDEEALRALVEAQIEGGIAGLVPCGTTGESVTLRGDEQTRVTRIVVEQSRGRVPVIAGAGTASTHHTIELARAAREAGADGLLLVCPYYNRPTQVGLEAHFRTVLGEVPLPTVLYNIPGRTGSDLSLDTLGRLADMEALVGIKEATGNIVKAQQIVARFGDRFSVLSGDDALTLGMMAVGARGVVSVTSNVAPAAVSDVVRRALSGDLGGARNAHLALLPLHEAMFVEANPGPVKAALAILGRVAPENPPSPRVAGRGIRGRRARGPRGREGSLLTLRVAVHGAGGRMGRAVLALVLADADASVAGALERPGSSVLGADVGTLGGGGPEGLAVTDDVALALADADVVIDFSLPGGTRAIAGACAERGLPLVVGTTGLDPAAEEALTRLSEKAPLVVAPNMSAGVTLLFHLAARAAALLGPSFDAEIVEMHHRQKVDAPSGTALRLAEGVARARGLPWPDAAVHGRSGHVGPRRDDEIGIMTLRGGDVVGEHTLVLAGPGERLELTHRARDRTIFARGAMRAAWWVVGRPPGRYDMADVIGIPR